jgi:hypothetical protein
MRRYEKPAITTMEGREIIEALGPAQASTSGAPIGGGADIGSIPVPRSGPGTFNSN